MNDFLPYCWYHSQLSSLRFQSLMEWLPAIRIYGMEWVTINHLICHKWMLSKLYFCKPQRKTQCARFSRPKLSAVLLCIIILGLLLNTVCLENSLMASYIFGQTFYNLFNNKVMDSVSADMFLYLHFHKELVVSPDPLCCCPCSGRL